MNNAVSVALGGLVVAALAGDALLNGGAGGVFVARKLLDLVEYIAFWR